MEQPMDQCTESWKKAVLHFGRDERTVKARPVFMPKITSVRKLQRPPSSANFCVTFIKMHVYPYSAQS